MNTANPMTYRTRSGRQFIVMATGSSDQNALLAFAVDEKSRRLGVGLLILGIGSL